MAGIDVSTEHGQRALERLENEPVIWLTTVGQSGAPYPNPIWFLWENDAILIYCEPTAAKLRHLARNNRVALNFNASPTGYDVVVFSGTARVDERAPSATAVPAFIEKYAAGIAEYGLTPESYAATYSVAIRVTPEKLWGF
jgi:PPOX class probable F420-dependent enzyme